MMVYAKQFTHNKAAPHKIYSSAQTNFRFSPNSFCASHYNLTEMQDLENVNSIWNSTLFLILISDTKFKKHLLFIVFTWWEIY